MASRVLLATLLSLALAYAASDDLKKESISRDLIQCNSQDGDVTLTDVEIVDPGHYLGEVDIDFTYPPKGSAQNKVINCIMVKNLMTTEVAKVSITDGGLGQTNVTIHITSSFSKGVDFSINLMGQ